MAGGKSKKTCESETQTVSEDVISNTGKTMTDSQFQTLMNKITEISQQMGKLLHIEGVVNGLEKTMNFLNAQYEDQKLKIQGLQEENKCCNEELAVTMNSISDIRTEHETLKSKIDELEQYSRSSNIEVVGMPETPQEDLDTVLSVIGKKLGLTITPDLIDAVHRVPTKSTTQPKPIIVRFRTRKTKEAMINQARKTKLQAKDLGQGLPDTPVYINEHLTPERKQIIYLAGQKKRDLSYKYLWTRGGNIYIKKDDNSHPIKINSRKDLGKIV